MLKRIKSILPDKNLKKIRSKYPNCNFSKGSKITNSSFGDYVTVLANSEIKNSEIKNHCFFKKETNIIDSSFGDHVTVHAKSIINNSKIQGSCIFNKETSITDSIFNDYVTVLFKTKIINSIISEYSYIASNSSVNNVQVGKFCSIGENVKIGLNKHPTKNFVSTYPALYSPDNVSCGRQFRNDRIFDDSVPKTVIGHDVWIGTSVIIPGGINIANGAIIAAGSVVVKDVEPYAIVGGNPAKIIRYRFTETEISKLLEINWWDWSVEKLSENIDSFSSIESFFEID